MDLTDSIAAKSDQLDAIDLIAGPQTFTIEKVTTHNAEQPFNFHLAGFPRVWRPGKSMRRVIVKAWGANAEAYAGKRVTLYCDPSIQFGNDVVGGTRISHMSGIDQPLKMPLPVKRGKSAMFTVQPLPDAPVPNPTRDWSTELILAGDDLDAITALGKAATIAGADTATLGKIRAKYTELKEGQS